MTYMTSKTRSALKCSVASFALFVAGGAAFAQETAQTTAAAETDTIVVTGSRIARPELDSMSPVLVVGAEDIAAKGAVNVEEILYDMPQVIPSQGGASNNPGDGAATLDLRGLGSARTLVLVNGRRWLSYDVTQIVDLNTIPAQLIEKADVLTGGRSAVYGSDAISGVVNFTMKQDFEGVQVDSQYRITGRGDGGTWSNALVIGGNFDEGRGNITMFANYTKRDPIMAGERAFGRKTYSDDDEGGYFFGGSSSVPGTRYTLATPFAGAAPGVFGSNTVGRINPNVFNADGSTRLYSGATDAFNFAPDNYLQLPQERWLIGGFAHYEVNDHLDVYTEMTYVNNRVDTQLAATPITGPAVVDYANNPFLTDAVRAGFAAVDAAQSGSVTGLGGLTDVANDGRVTMQINRRMNEVGPRLSQNERQAFRTLIGARGEITGDWRYDAYYTYARTTTLEEQYGNVSYSRFAQAVAGCPAGSADGCVAANIFGPNRMSPEAAKFVSVDTKNSTKITEQVANVSITNSNLFNLGLGADGVGIAVGAEWRSVEGAFQPDFFLASGDVAGFNAGSPTIGGYNVKEVFGELNVPVLADRPFFHNLELNGAIRYSDYNNNVGSTLAYSGGAIWSPIRDITFRGQYQRSVRAPSVSALYLGSSVGFPSFNDYCGTSDALSNANLRQSCLNNGVPADLLGDSQLNPSAQIRAIYGGNPNLKEEKSDTWTAGVVLQPTFAPGLTVTVDYYNIKIKDAILANGPGATNVRDACFGTPGNGYVPYDASFCAYIPRDASFAVDNLINTNLNAGFLKTSGVDFEARYTIPFGFGIMGGEDSRLNLRVSGTRLIGFDNNPLASIPNLLVKCAGKFGATCGDPYAKWRGNATATFISGPANMQLRVNYIGSTDDDGTSGYDAVWVDHIGGYATFDLSLAYDVTENFTARFGVNNLGDKQPPIIGDANNQQTNTFPNTFDVLGRRFFVGVTAKF